MSGPPGAYLAEFGSSEELLEAVGVLRDAGYAGIEAFAPMPVDGLEAALGVKATRLSTTVLLGGVLGGGGFYLLEYLLAVVSYPHNVGGRPVFSWPAFIFPAVEMALLGAALFGLIGLLVSSRLPRLHHPLFDVPAFDRASRDRYFVSVGRDDPRFAADATRALLESLHPVSLHEVDR